MKKSELSAKSDGDLGRFSFREHTVTKQKELQSERNIYEKEYLARYLKQQKTKLKIAALEQKLRLSQIELEEPKPDLKKERKNYEKEYLARYLKQQKTKLKIAALEQKLRLSQIELEEPKPNIKKERKDYEKEYLTRYKKIQKAKSKKKILAIR